MDTIKITKKDGGNEYFSLDEFSRWMCLVEAFHFIENAAISRNIPDIGVLLKSMAIEKYIEERYPSMRHDVGCEYELGLL